VRDPWKVRQRIESTLDNQAESLAQKIIENIESNRKFDTETISLAITWNTNLLSYTLMDAIEPIINEELISEVEDRVGNARSLVDDLRSTLGY
jgi:GTP-sensing pleiotropic transcriptional regulator CodY